MPFNVFSLADTYGAGKRDRQEFDARANRNALADLERSYLDQRMRNDQAAESRAATQFSQEQQKLGTEQRVADLELMHAGLSEVQQNPAALERWLPEFVRVGMFPKDTDPNAWRSVPPEQISAKAGEYLKGTRAAIAALSGGQGGPKIGAFNPGDYTPESFARFQQSGNAADLRRYVAPERTAPKSFRALTPTEIQAAGLPPGTSAQLDTATGKIDVLSKRDTTGGLSQKDATTAKMKLNTVSVARRQLANIRTRFAGIRNSASAGPFGQGKIPTEGGRAFDRAVDQMRSTLTALTRVPGVGAMSDYETKLDQAKFPTRNEYESVTEQQIADLDNMLNAIEAGYRDLLNGTGPQATPDGEAALGDDEAIDFAALPRGRGATGGW